MEQLNAATLTAWGADELAHAHAASAALLAYAEHTQGRALSHVFAFAPFKERLAGLLAA